MNLIIKEANKHRSADEHLPIVVGRAGVTRSEQIEMRSSSKSDRKQITAQPCNFCVSENDILKATGQENVKNSRDFTKYKYICVTCQKYICPKHRVEFSRCLECAPPQ